MAWSVGLVAILVASGAVIGFLSGLVGLGGTVLIIPLFAFLLPHMGVPSLLVIKLSFGSALLTALLTATSGYVIHGARSELRVSSALLYAVPAAVAAFLGGITASHLRPSFLHYAFGVVLLISSIAFPLRTGRDQRELYPFGVSAIPLGLLVGYLSALVGLGGALFTLFLFAGVLRHPMRRVVGLSVLVQMFGATFALVAYAIGGQGVQGLPSGSIGYVNVPLGIVAALGSIPMALFGARMTYRVPRRWPRFVVSALMALLAIRFFLSAR